MLGAGGGAVFVGPEAAAKSPKLSSAAVANVPKPSSAALPETGAAAAKSPKLSSAVGGFFPFGLGVWSTVKERTVGLERRRVGREEVRPRFEQISAM
jgi:hypothetical protein